jgi:hypothetical protein
VRRSSVRSRALLGARHGVRMYMRYAVRAITDITNITTNITTTTTVM